MVLYDASVPTPDASVFFLVRLLGASVCLLLGIFPVLAGLGLLDTGQAIEPLAIPFAILFGLVFIALGTAFVFFPVRQLARNHGATTARAAMALAARLLVERIDARSACAAAGVAFLGIACVADVAGIRLPLLGDQQTLATAVTIEFITIHAFPFLVVALWFLTHTQGAAYIYSALFTGMLGAVYAFAAWAFGGGLLGVGWLVYLLVPNLLVFVRTEKSVESIALAIGRWAMKFALFMVVGGIVGGGGRTAESAVAVGAVYFSLLALLELLRLPEVPLDLARAVSRETELSDARTL